MNLTIYDKMTEQLTVLLSSMNAASNEEPTPIPFKLVIPVEVQDYLSTRRAALSDASCRAEDTLSTHLTWVEYHQTMAKTTPLVDMVAWEIAYQELASSYSTTVEAIACIKMSMSPDPANPFITIKGLKPMLVDEKTTPEYVALANVYAEENDWDLTELKPPILSLSLEDMSSFDDMVKHVFEGMGIDSSPPPFIEVLLNTQAGDDVTLA